MVYAIIGLPNSGRTFLPGIRFEPPRAGITASRRKGRETISAISVWLLSCDLNVAGGNRRIRKVFALRTPQLAISLAEGQEFFVSSETNDVTLIQHDYAVGISKCGEPVRNNEGRPSLHQTIYRFLNLLFGG